LDVKGRTRPPERSLGGYDWKTLGMKKHGENFKRCPMFSEIKLLRGVSR